MDTMLDQLAALAMNRLPAEQAAATRAAIERSPELRQAFERFTFVGRTITGDARDSVPAAALTAAKELGRRLDSLRQPSILERLDAGLRAVIARLAFDSRIDGPIVGLRGGTGFVLTYEVETSSGRVDVDLECLPLGNAGEGDAFELVAQASAATGDFGAGRVEVLPLGQSFDEAQMTPSTSATSAPIDAHGMFRLRLAAGSYRLVLRRDQADAIELPQLDLP
jgi:hypothetical protein